MVIEHELLLHQLRRHAIANRPAPAINISGVYIQQINNDVTVSIGELQDGKTELLDEQNPVVAPSAMASELVYVLASIEVGFNII